MANPNPVPPPAPRPEWYALQVHYSQNNFGGWQWEMAWQNGVIFAQSAIGYPTRARAREAIRRMTRYIANARFKEYEIDFDTGKSVPLPDDEQKLRAEIAKMMETIRGR